MPGSQDWQKDRSQEVLHFGVSWPDFYRTNRRKHAENETYFPKVKTETFTASTEQNEQLQYLEGDKERAR